MIEPTDPYERGFIDGMAKQRDSAVQRFVEGGTPDSELAEHKRIIREQQAEIEALKKQIPDWENINKPNPFIGMSENGYTPLPGNSGLGGIALKKASEK